MVYRRDIPSSPANLANDAGNPAGDKSTASEGLFQPPSRLTSDFAKAQEVHPVGEGFYVFASSVPPQTSHWTTDPCNRSRLGSTGLRRAAKTMGFTGGFAAAEFSCICSEKILGHLDAPHPRSPSALCRRERDWPATGPTETSGGRAHKGRLHEGALRGRNAPHSASRSTVWHFAPGAARQHDSPKSTGERCGLGALSRKRIMKDSAARVLWMGRGSLPVMAPPARGRRWPNPCWGSSSHRRELLTVEAEQVLSKAPCPPAQDFSSPGKASLTPHPAPVIRTRPKALNK
jgi:hypothetical protein